MAVRGLYDPTYHTTYLLITSPRSWEAEKLAARYRKFNLPALLDAAVNVTGLKDVQCEYLSYCDLSTAYCFRYKGSQMRGRAMQ
jgi:hypothetical protein